MARIRNIVIFIWAACTCCSAFADSIPNGSLQFIGGVQHDGLFPTDGGDYNRPQWAKIDHLSNTYVDLGLRYQHYKPNKAGLTGVDAQMRLEMMQWPMLGYETGFAGYGVGHLHAGLDFSWGHITLGDVYGQFGSGLILRLYEERSLGVDNALRGGKIDIAPYKGLRLELLGGKQRRYWQMYDDHAWGFNYRQDAVLGANLELQVDEWSSRMQDAGAYLLLGASWVSKYDAFDTIYTQPVLNPSLPANAIYNVPQWVGAADLRAQFQMKGWNALLEYAIRSKDPHMSNIVAYNGIEWKPGTALLASLSYSQKGLSVLGQVKRSQNMSFRSDRLEMGIVGQINHLPAFANQHTYALAALYPYATQMDGEWALQGEVRYTWKRGTRMGGKYGTTLKLNASHVRGTDPASHFFRSTAEPYYTDVNLELNKKINKQWYIAAMLMYQTYNKQVVEGHGELIRSGIGVVDVKWATTKDVQMRAELQYLFSKQDEGQWIYALYELSLFKQLMLTFSEQYCIGHGTIAKSYVPGVSLDVPEQGNHYYSALATWLHGAHRLSAGYTKTRAGYNCAGGVCRYVPKQEGVVLNYSFTW